jgi:hypothetical protein
LRKIEPEVGRMVGARYPPFGIDEVVAEGSGVEGGCTGGADEAPHQGGEFLVGSFRRKPPLLGVIHLEILQKAKEKRIAVLLEEIEHVLVFRVLAGRQSGQVFLEKGHAFRGCHPSSPEKYAQEENEHECSHYRKGTEEMLPQRFRRHRRTCHARVKLGSLSEHTIKAT